MTTPLTTVAKVKSYAGIQTANQDALIAELIPQCMAALDNFCNRKLASRTVNGMRNGNGSTGIMLSNYPVTEVQAVYIDGRTIPQSVNCSAGWFLPALGRRLVLRGGYVFTQGDRNVEIDYVAGYGDASGVSNADLAPWPDDLVLAINMFVLTRLKERDRLGVGSKSLAGESITFVDATSGTSGSSQGIPSAARIILEGYQNTVPEYSE